MVIIRGAAQPARPRPVPQAPGGVADAVKMAYRASLATGAPLSQRAMADRFGIPRRRAARLAAEVTAEHNGLAVGAARL
jgi:hypothetical protein